VAEGGDDASVPPRCGVALLLDGVGDTGSGLDVVELGVFLGDLGTAGLLAAHGNGAHAITTPAHATSPAACRGEGTEGTVAPRSFGAGPA
jgi:hypothetical protein